MMIIEMKTFMMMIIPVLMKMLIIKIMKQSKILVKIVFVTQAALLKVIIMMMK